MRVIVAITVLIALLGAVACSSDGSGPKSTAVVDGSDGTAAAATAAALIPFDPDVLTAIALQPGDVPASLPQTDASFGHQYAGDVIVYSTTYGHDDFSVSSTIGHAAPGLTIDPSFLRLRQTESGLFRVEQNYTIDGADQAFSYGNPQGVGVATLILKDGYYVNIVVQARDPARVAEAQDQANLDRYTKTVFDRLKAYLDDPSSVTPVPGTARYATPAPTPD